MSDTNKDLKQSIEDDSSPLHQQMLNGHVIEGFKLFKREELHGSHSKLVEKDLAFMSDHKQPAYKKKQMGGILVKSNTKPSLNITTNTPTTMTTPDFERAKQLVFKQLDALDPNLFYHGKHHTVDYVLPASLILSKEQGLTEEQTLIVKTAALFHDVGFLDQYEKNEPQGVERAKAALPDLGYSSEQIEEISKCIMATQLPQSPGENILAQIVCDSDLYHAGTNKYFLNSESLRLELCAVKSIQISQRKWHEGNIKFLESHTYFTDAAKKLLQPIKEKNLQETKELLGL